MTDISKLGEFGLIHRLTDDIKIKNESTVKGVGDDCAVMHYPDKEVLVTTDMLMEGVHFDLTYIDQQHLGYKSAMVNISDIIAMGGTPRQMTVSLALSKRFTVEDMEQFYSGLRMACDKYGIDIVGGDTTSSYTGMATSSSPVRINKSSSLLIFFSFCILFKSSISIKNLCKRVPALCL